MKEQSFEEQALNTYTRYMEEGLQMFPPFKGYGMKMIQFAIEEPQMFQYVFSQNREGSYAEMMDQKLKRERIVSVMTESLGITQAEAQWLYGKVLVYLIGMGTLFVANSCIMSMEEISEGFGSVFRGLMLHLKHPADERVKLIPQAGSAPITGLEEYLKGKKNVIVGYGPEKELYQIRVDAILYFEAVGENVFAYTKNNIYEIKQRLYQIEELVTAFSFVRTSKSLLVNTRKIVEIKPDTGGRGNIKMLNGEIVVASRLYYKTLLEVMKNPVG